MRVDILRGFNGKIWKMFPQSYIAHCWDVCVTKGWQRVYPRIDLARIFHSKPWLLCIVWKNSSSEVFFMTELNFQNISCGSPSHVNFMSLRQTWCSSWIELLKKMSSRQTFVVKNIRPGEFFPTLYDTSDFQQKMFVVADSWTHSPLSFVEHSIF